ncbi:restriction endonuclease subunit R [Nostoc sp. FACHB-87]|uniref:restriction endonuclease subunit R n=1 Tax=Nostocales TaxID=1161 RepID=UPI00168244F6|nr:MULTISPECIES: restriction endonuclease subunit R [Nostocales]MBD2301722.1 restriction endonuclease subunit R [Nostoc sp. FACHB-190]MBD2454536.1 restriction endonuclease subunit R [Nostoc sp. FACHB-87]MBD2479087.1 restriction endonuclease subunit R [Anabaena sp. FACHB-83]MBD2490927.1 restriction endonuclease subunit R [Aulosira sp. FACHB-615]
MVQVVQAQNIGLAYLEERFSLQISENEGFFTEWLENLPSVTNLDQQYLDRVKANFLSLVKRPPILENAVKMVVISPLLDLAGFYREPYAIATEESVEITVEDAEEIVRGRIDVLVIKEQFWLLVIESKRASLSLLEAIPQALVYMLGSSNTDKPVFGLVTNGEDIQFIKLIKYDKPQYALSDKFTLSRRENELYKVLQILKKLSQVLH